MLCCEVKLFYLLCVMLLISEGRLEAAVALLTPSVSAQNYTKNQSKTQEGRVQCVFVLETRHYLSDVSCLSTY